MGKQPSPARRGKEVTVRSGMIVLACAGALLTALPCPAPACILCGQVRLTPTLREEANSPDARLILCGTLGKARLFNEAPGKGETDFHIEAVLRTDPKLPPQYRKGKGDVLVLPHYLPPQKPGTPTRSLVFCNVIGDRFDLYRGIEIASPAAADYLTGALALDPRDSRCSLLYFFRFLDHPDKVVAQDAYMEFVKASDREVADAGRYLSAAKLRTWVRDPKTPAERLGLFAFLLGSCGGQEDVAWFASALANPRGRFAEAYDGILSGYIRLRSKEGWAVAVKLLREGRATLPIRLSTIRTLRFYQAWLPRESRSSLLVALGAVLQQGELADLAIEELRKGEMWDLTEAVLALFGRKGLDAPIQRRAIVRYALCCPLPRAKQFVAELRKREAELVHEVEETFTPGQK
jgi:hypothetical protein